MQSDFKIEASKLHSLVNGHLQAYCIWYDIFSTGVLHTFQELACLVTQSVSPIHQTFQRLSDLQIRRSRHIFKLWQQRLNWRNIVEISFTPFFFFFAGKLLSRSARACSNALIGPGNAWGVRVRSRAAAAAAAAVRWTLRCHCCEV